MRIIKFLMPLALLLSCSSQAVQYSSLSSSNGIRSINQGSNSINNINNNADLTVKSSIVTTKEKTVAEPELKTVSLRAQADKSESAVIIKYEVENHSEQSLYLWDRMIGYKNGSQIIDENLAYVFFEEPKTVRIIRAELPLPEDREIGRKEIPFVRIFPPKSKLSGEIRLENPIREFSPYYEPLSEETQQLVKFSDIRLIIGWTRTREGMKISERTIGGEKVLAIRGAWGKPYQEIVETRISLSADLLIYKTVFDRQMPLQ
ncbi:MAG: hypothetical protein M3209_12170 [Acidobacteriota bacterium]|nr:hypothetical protein [Acidobacteriota bacterium]